MTGASMVVWLAWTALGAVVLAGLRTRRRGATGPEAVVVLAGSAILALRLVLTVAERGPGAAPTTASTPWLPLAGGGLHAGLRLDATGAVVVLLAAGLTALLLGDAIRRRSDRPLPVGTVLGSLLALVATGGVALAGDLLALLAFWLLGGALQAYLVSLGQPRDAAAEAGRALLLAETVGSLGLGLAALFGYLGSGSLDPERMVAAARSGALNELRTAALAQGVVLAALCRASLVPLHAWLVRAAGVRPPAWPLWLTGLHGLGAIVLLLRLRPLLPPLAVGEGAWLAGVAAVLLGLIALGDPARPRTLAAVAGVQLAAMVAGALVAADRAVLALAVTQVPAAILAGLGLAARPAGPGARRSAAVSRGLLIVGVAALAAVPGTAGFRAWQEILAALLATHLTGPAGLLIAGALLATAALVRRVAGPAAEAAGPPRTTLRLVLAIWVLVAAPGLASLLPGVLAAPAPAAPGVVTLGLVLGVAVLGAGLGLGGRRAALASTWPWPASWRGLDVWLRQLAAGPGPLANLAGGAARRAAGGALALDGLVLAGVVEGVGWVGRVLARACVLADRVVARRLVDGMVRLVAGPPAVVDDTPQPAAVRPARGAALPAWPAWLAVAAALVAVLAAVGLAGR